MTAQGRIRGRMPHSAISVGGWEKQSGESRLELATEKGDPGRPRVCAILAAWEKSGKLEGLYRENDAEHEGEKVPEAIVATTKKIGCSRVMLGGVCDLPNNSSHTLPPLYPL